MTHAFSSLLFLARQRIHAMAASRHTQDGRPQQEDQVHYITMLTATMAIAGIFPFADFQQG